MTQEIIEMAQECGLVGMRPHLDGIYIESLLAFAKLVAEAERERIKQANAPEIEKINAHIEHAMREVQRLGQEIEQEPVAYYLPHKGFYWAKPTSISAPTIADVEPLPLYTHPPKETT
jgi:hypothetical protein